MAATTVLSVGSVTITANGGTTGTLLAQVTTALAGLTGTQIVTVGSSDATIPTVPATGGPYELIINPGYTGSLNIPTGYTYVINGTTGDVTGGSSSSVIIGNNLNYSGGAGSLIATGTGGSISDNTGGAEIAIASGDYTVNASGGNDTVAFDSGSTSQATVSGANSEIIVGGTTITSGPFAAGTSTVSSVDTIDITPTSPGTDTILAQTGGAANLIASAPVSVDATGGAITVELVPSTSAALTLTATGGSQLIFDNVGKSIVNAGPSTQYIEADNVSGVSTITSSTGGEDTVYALSSADYVATLASASEFIGSANGAVTVDAAQNATLFGGASGGTYNLGSDSAGFFFLWGHVWNGPGGVAASVVSNDTVIGGAGSPTVSIWGNSNENVVVSQQGSAAFNAGGTYVAYGNDDTINATAATTSSSGMPRSLALAISPATRPCWVRPAATRTSPCSPTSRLAAPRPTSRLAARTRSISRTGRPPTSCSWASMVRLTSKGCIRRSRQRVAAASTTRSPMARRFSSPAILRAA